MTVCKRVTYWGRVQGVGFRYTAQGLSERYAVAGYVKNLPNGQVELVAEGEAEEVDRFLAAVAQQMARYIKGQTVENEMPQEFDGFNIRA